MCFIYWLKFQASFEAKISLVRITLTRLESFKLIILKIKINKNNNNMLKHPIEMLLIFATIDALIEEELKKEKEYNLIGKKYTIRDNSYIREIVNGKKKNYHCDLCGETVIIISQPYITMVEGAALKSHEQRMIKVKSMKIGFIYEVMFNEGWIQ